MKKKLWKQSTGLVALAFPAMYQNVVHWRGASERLAMFKE